MKADRLLACTAAGLGAVAFSLLPVTPRLVWNRTESMPTGLYFVSRADRLIRGDVVAYQPGPGEAAWLESRQYTGKGWLLIKQVAALDGDEVCREQESVFVNKVLVARAQKSDSAGRDLPAWQGCSILKNGDAFFLSDHARSIDGRYFGIQPAERIVGRARLLRALAPPRLPARDASDSPSGIAQEPDEGSSDGRQP